MDAYHRDYPVDPPYNGPPRYEMLPKDGAIPIRPPPHRRNVPRYHSQNQKKRGCGCGCLKCICCCYCFLVTFVILLVSILAFLYFHYEPKLPTYTVEKLDIGDFEVKSDLSVNAEFIVIVKAVNPNGDISIRYDPGSSVVVLHSDTTLCSGKLPTFRQGGKNTTHIHLTLTGKSDFSSGIQEALEASKEKRRIPLLIKVKVPVTIEIWNFPLKEFNVLVNCSLVIDRLTPKQKVSIVSSKYEVAASVGDWYMKF